MRKKSLNLKSASIEGIAQDVILEDEERMEQIQELVVK